MTRSADAVLGAARLQLLRLQARALAHLIARRNEEEMAGGHEWQRLLEELGARKTEKGYEGDGWEIERIGDQRWRVRGDTWYPTLTEALRRVRWLLEP